MSSLVAVKANARARENEEKQKQERRRNLMVLILSFLREQGYLDTEKRLETECNVSLSRIAAADNVDLPTVLQEYEEYYDMKFGRKPKLVRKVGDDEHSAATRAALPGIKSASKRPVERGGGGSGARGAGASSSSSAGGGGGATEEGSGSARGTGSNNRNREGSKSSGSERGVNQGGGMGDRPSSRGSNLSNLTGTTAGDGGTGGLGLEAKGITPLDRRAAKAEAKGEGEEDPGEFFERRVLKPLPDFGNAELRELGASIQRDIYLDNPNVRWDAIAGLKGAKKLLKEAVVMPHKYPQYFQGLLSPWKGVLLYGPPGTGKTMLAKAVATECKTTFFNISASTVVSKWRGDSEKLIRVLFELARYHSPSTIFMDEIDAIMSSRDGAGEHEASRRMKTELLIQMDGLAKTNDVVFVLCATNLPWELDMAMLRRLEKRILVPLPDKDARTAIFSHLLEPHERDAEVDVRTLAEMTEGYSGADAMVLAKECAMCPLRRLMAQLEDEDGNANPNACLEMGTITLADVEAAFKSSKPSARLYAEKYHQWSEEYGQMS